METTCSETRTTDRQKSTEKKPRNKPQTRAEASPIVAPRCGEMVGIKAERNERWASQETESFQKGGMRYSSGHFGWLEKKTKRSKKKKGSQKAQLREEVGILILPTIREQGEELGKGKIRHKKRELINKMAKRQKTGRRWVNARTT